MHIRESRLGQFTLTFLLSMSFLFIGKWNASANKNKKGYQSYPTSRKAYKSYGYGNAYGSYSLPKKTKNPYKQSSPQSYRVNISKQKKLKKKKKKKKLSPYQSKLKVSVAHPYLLRRLKKKQRTYIKVGLTGALRKYPKKRSPVNLAIVLDRSGSMHGTKLQKAKEASAWILKQLRPDDVLSVVTYNSTVQVLLPATKVLSKERIRKKIMAIRAGGSTALFGGVSKGLSEVRKFLSKKRINRVILLSDGIANIGPSSPNALGRLGRASAKQGITITTIGLGLGYNEDLMTRLAMHSDGNHGFAKSANHIKDLFKSELNDIFAVVAQQIKIKIRCSRGIRPVRVLDRRAKIRGNRVEVRLNQLYSKQEKYVLLEVEIPPSLFISTMPLVDVSVLYTEMNTYKPRQLAAQTHVILTEQPILLSRNLNRSVMIQVVESIANERTRLAVAARDKGKLKSARIQLLNNAAYLQTMAKRLGSVRLQQYSYTNNVNAQRLSKKQWNCTRKKMRQSQHKIQNQTK